jgi:hypothetical protein
MAEGAAFWSAAFTYLGNWSDIAPYNGLTRVIRFLIMDAYQQMEGVKMQIQFTSQCLNCGQIHDDGGMTALTSEGSSTHESVHSTVSYGRCCRAKALRGAGIQFNANGEAKDTENYARFMAFLASETIETIRTQLG